KRKNYVNILDCLYNLMYNYIIALSEEPEKNEYVAFVISEILANISNPNYDVTRTIQKIPLTDDYIRKLFFKETGKTPLQYLTNQRINTAKQLLSLPNHAGLLIKEIALRSGFSDCYYFSRVFKKATGCSPEQWTNENRVISE
ncbi:MAG: helix-turn-helix transcriptional regulator, partial [Eubacteriales bacterium]